jgi:hypothetical protein
MAATPDSAGYWLVAADGGLFSYGDAVYFGSVPGQGITGPPAVVGVCPTPTGAGYWLVGNNGAGVRRRLFVVAGEAVFDAPAQMESRISAAAATIATPSAISMTGTRL